MLYTKTPPHDAPSVLPRSPANIHSSALQVPSPSCSVQHWECSREPRPGKTYVFEEKTINEINSEIQRIAMVIHICGPSVRRLRQEDHQLEASLGYTDRACIRKKGIGTEREKKGREREKKAVRERREGGREEEEKKEREGKRERA